LNVATKIRISLVGLGAVNLGLLTILQRRKNELLNLHGIDLSVVAVADSSGVAVRMQGWDYQELIDLKRTKKSASAFEGYQPGSTSEMITDLCPVDILVESSPGNIHTGMPGLAICRKALAQGTRVVLANKTPLIFAFDELMHLARQRNIRYSATVCGGLPVINVLTRDLSLAEIKSIRGVLNATSNFVLQEMEQGRSPEAAVAEARRIGAAEADPSHDLHGHDTANKLYIMLRSATSWKGGIQDISVTGIQYLNPDQVVRAAQQGNKYKLVAEAIAEDSHWTVRVTPELTEASSFLGSCNGWEMGVEIASDLYDKVYLKNYEADPLGTSAAVLRDIFDLCGVHH